MLVQFLLIIFSIFIPMLPLHAFGQNEKPWHERISLKGDFRFQHEYTSKTGPNDLAALHRERIRLRPDLRAQVNDEIRTRVRLITADGGSPTGSNFNMNNNASKKDVYFDIVSVDWTPHKDLKLSLGKMENPLRVVSSSMLIYDANYTPEGTAFTFDNGFLFTTLASFFIQERTPQASDTNPSNSWLLAGLMGFKSDISESTNLTMAAGYHGFTSLKNNTALAPGATASNFYGNSQANGKYAYDYQVGELLAQLRMKYDSWQLVLFLDAINNFALGEGNKGVITGTQLQSFNEGKSIWTFGYAYQSTDKDATVSALNNSNFANGIDDSFGHIAYLARRVAADIHLSLTWYHARVQNAGNPFTTDKGQFDVVVPF